MAITRAIDSLCLYEDIDVFPESDSIWELLDQVEAFDEASVGLSDKASGQESWLERARELENKGKLKAALRYYTKAESQHDFDRCAARQDFERGESRKAIDAFFELNEYELALVFTKGRRY